MSDVTLIAKTRVKFGGKVERVPAGIVRTEDATEVEPGKEFKVDSDTAEDLILAGAALSPSDYKAEQEASATAEERVAKMRAEIGKADIEDKARKGDSMAINANAHLEAQRREEQMVEDAQKSAKGGKRGAATEDGEEKPTGGKKK